MHRLLVWELDRRFRALNPVVLLSPRLVLNCQSESPSVVHFGPIDWMELLFIPPYLHRQREREMEGERERERERERAERWAGEEMEGITVIEAEASSDRPIKEDE